MLRKLLSKIKLYFAASEFDYYIAKEELDRVFKVSPQITREQHETYKLGEFTATVVGSEQELKDRAVLFKVNKAQKSIAKQDKLAETALNHLIKVSDD